MEKKSNNKSWLVEASARYHGTIEMQYSYGKGIQVNASTTLPSETYGRAEKQE